MADANGSVARIYDFTVNIDDRAGSMASIMNILAEHGLSIKNIGITHSRERAEGAVRLEFYDKTSLAKAREVLCEKDIRLFNVYDLRALRVKKPHRKIPVKPPAVSSSTSPKLPLLPEIKVW